MVVLLSIVNMECLEEVSIGFNFNSHCSISSYKIFRKNDNEINILNKRFAKVK